MNKFLDEDRSMPINDLSRPEWHRRASENLHRFLLQLEAQLTSATITSQTAATKLLVVEVKRRLNEFDRLVAEETGLPVHIADDPLSAVAEGTGRVLQELQFLKRVTSNSKL